MSIPLKFASGNREFTISSNSFNPSVNGIEGIKVVEYL